MAESQPPRNRLSIAHLMLWMLGTAIALALHRQLLARLEPAENLSVAWRVYVIVYSLLAGPKIGGSILYLSHRARGKAGFPSQPGHWLLAIEGMSTVLVYLGVLAAEWTIQQLPAAFTQLPNCVATAVAYSIAYRRQPSMPGLWKAIFVILIMQHAYAGLLNFAVLWVIFPFISTPGGLLPLLLAVLFVLAAIRDPKRHQRDYLHWTGGFTLVATEVIQWLMYALLWTGLLVP
jgi:hypothetical protein